jgi:hypothetical protein
MNAEEVEEFTTEFVDPAWVPAWAQGLEEEGRQRRAERERQEAEAQAERDRREQEYAAQLRELEARQNAFAPSPDAAARAAEVLAKARAKILARGTDRGMETGERGRVDVPRDEVGADQRDRAVPPDHRGPVATPSSGQPEGHLRVRKTLARWSPEATRAAAQWHVEHLDEYELPKRQREAAEYILGKMSRSGWYEVGCSGSELFRAGIMPKRSGEDALASLVRDGRILGSRTKAPRMEKNRGAQRRRAQRHWPEQWFYRLSIPAKAVRSL